MSDMAWLMGAGGLAAAVLAAWQLSTRTAPPTALVACEAVAGTGAERAGPARAAAGPAPVGESRAETAAEPDRVGRYVTWLEERDATRTRMQEQVLAAMRDTAAALERCSELAGDQQDVQVLLDGALDKLQSAMRGLHGDISPLGNPPLGQGDSVARSLENLMDLVQSASLLTVDTRIDDAVDGCLSEAQRTHVLHIVREALANAVRHSGGTRVALRATVENRRFVVSVSDDGHGFDSRAPRPAGQGLAKMQARAEAARSLLQVESARGAGTIITVAIPLDTAPTHV
jgi:signal transduction histidine kinase